MAILTGGQAVIETLHSEDVSMVFGVLGSTLLPVYDALVNNPIRLITPRSEDGAGHMADAYARVSGKPGVVLSTAGPGAAGVVAAMGEAYAESWPLLHIATQVPTPYLDKQKGVYHDGPNQRQIFRSVSSWDHRITSHGEIPEAIHEAFKIMRSNRPRPVFLEIPADILRQSADVSVGTSTGSNPSPALDMAQVRQAANMLAEANKPVLWAGGGVVKADAGESLKALAELLNAPILCTNGSKGIVSDDHSLMLGNITTISPIVQEKVLKQGDLLLGLGTRFSQRATKWWKLEVPGQLIHVDIDREELGKNFPPQLGVNADAREFLEAVLADLTSRGPIANDWTRQSVSALKSEAYGDLRARNPDEFAMLDSVRAVLPRDAIVAAQSMIGHWCRFAFPCYESRKFLYANSYGSMGFAFHAAIGAKLAAPDRVVAAFCGDGGFMSGIGELATIAQYELDIPLVVVNNGGFAILRTRQQHNYGRVIGSDLYNPDFQKLASAYDFTGVKINNMNELSGALDAAIKRGGCTMIEVPIEFQDYRGGAIE